MDELMKDYVDLFRYFHPYASDAFSCWDQRNDARSRNEGVRIDYTICDKGFLPQIVTTDILNLPKKWSDHTAVSVTLLEQPRLADHPRPKLSATNIKQLREDRRQKRLTSLFVRKPAAGSDAAAYSPSHPGGGNVALTPTRSGLSTSAVESDTRESISLTISVDKHTTDAKNASQLRNLPSQAVHGPIETKSPPVLELDSASNDMVVGAADSHKAGGQSSNETVMAAVDSNQAADATNAAKRSPAFTAEGTFDGDADHRAGKTCTAGAIRQNDDRLAPSELAIRQCHGLPEETRMSATAAEKSELQGQARGVSTSAECVPDDNRCVDVWGGSRIVCEGEPKAISRHTTDTEWKDDSERKDVGGGGRSGSAECPKKAMPAEMEGVEKMAAAAAAAGGGGGGENQVGKDAEQCELEKVSEVNWRDSHNLRGSRKDGGRQVVLRPNAPSRGQQHADLLDDEGRQVVLRPSTPSRVLSDANHLLERSDQGNLLEVLEQGNPLKAADQKSLSKPSDTRKNPLKLSDDQLISRKAAQGPKKAGAAHPKSSLSVSGRTGAKQRGIETFFSPIGGKPMPGAPAEKRRKL
ncbi:hypothetical protein CBR_g28474 [Chara braunii]|uniref:Endonuclease/exonuclease/phosphatase domain-containing protein n=1 Tax=Chara braunii TaxID=69332 RepID=A0A388JW54_CHABU|nr:hypothetical protein CBR_g28474 [Chara braunii]|eukprot:GBG61997.1 hypothetical protein CBR_g28474 [Chara braunii]